MKTRLLTRATFDSSHEHPECGPYPHGHQFAVEAWGEKDLTAPLFAILEELHLRNLSRMLNGGSQSGDGIAAWIMERLLVTNPEVDGVTVGYLNKQFTVIRERR